MKFTHLLTNFILVLIISCSSPQLSNIADNVVEERDRSSTENLMPVPQKISRNDGRFIFNSKSKVFIKGNSKRVLFAANQFLRRTDQRTGIFFEQGIINEENISDSANATIIIEYVRPGKLEVNEDESYNLSISSGKVILKSTTDIGALRGLQTLYQLIDNDSQEYFLPASSIEDKPRFTWRGLLLDPARHFLPVDAVKRNLDGMAFVKMNVLHFHLCDNQGWRVESKTFPKLQQLASDGEYYTQQQIKEIIDYASLLGIRVVPEFDVPGHATAILTAYPEYGSDGTNKSYSLERNSGVFNPVLNPIKPETYYFLDRLFTEMASLFPDEYFHIGGDENNGKDWRANKQISDFMSQNKYESPKALQVYFNNKIITTLKRQNKKMVGWEEILQEGLSKDAVIHSWAGKSTLYKAASQGYTTILSNGYYIDLMLPASDHYMNDPLPPVDERSEKEKKYSLTPEQEKLILGGEATMWAELVTAYNVDSRVWPRTAAIAERLWSAGSVKNVEDMYRRLNYISLELERVGLTHLKNKEAILRNICNGHDLRPAQILADVCEPYKVYTRNYQGTQYKTYSPFTLLTDACAADAPDAVRFRFAVEHFAQNPSEKDKNIIVMLLTKWRNNHDPFVALAQQSPVLKNAVPLSEKLKTVSEIGLEALDKGHTSDNWYNEKIKILENYLKETEKKKEQNTFEDMRLEIPVIPYVMTLLDRTNPEAARKRLDKTKSVKTEEPEAVH